MAISLSRASLALALLFACCLLAPATATTTRQNGMDGGSRLRANARGSLTPGTTDGVMRDRVSTISDDNTAHFLFPNDPRFPGVFHRSADGVTPAPRLTLEPRPPAPPNADPAPGSLDFLHENSHTLAPFPLPPDAEAAIAAAGDAASAGSAVPSAVAVTAGGAPPMTPLPPLVPSPPLVSVAPTPTTAPATAAAVVTADPNAPSRRRIIPSSSAESSFRALATAAGSALSSVMGAASRAFRTQRASTSPLTAPVGLTTTMMEPMMLTASASPSASRPCGSFCRRPEGGPAMWADFV